MKHFANLAVRLTFLLGPVMGLLACSDDEPELTLVDSRPFTFDASPEDIRRATFAPGALSTGTASALTIATRAMMTWQAQSMVAILENVTDVPPSSLISRPYGTKTEDLTKVLCRFGGKGSVRTQASQVLYDAVGASHLDAGDSVTFLYEDCKDTAGAFDYERFGTESFVVESGLWLSERQFRSDSGAVNVLMDGAAIARSDTQFPFTYTEGDQRREVQDRIRVLFSGLAWQAIPADFVSLEYRMEDYAMQARLVDAQTGQARGYEITTDRPFSIGIGKLFDSALSDSLWRFEIVEPLQYVGGGISGFTSGVFRLSDGTAVMEVNTLAGQSVYRLDLDGDGQFETDSGAD